MRRSDFLRSTGVRFTLLYVALYLLSTVILLVTLYLIEARSLDEDLRDRVDARIEELQDVYRFGGLQEVIQDIEAKRRSHLKLRTFDRLTDENGGVLTANLPEIPVTLGRQQFSVDVAGQGARERIQIVARTVKIGDATLTVGMEPVWREAIDSLFVRAALGTLIAALVLGGAIGALMTRRYLSRIDAITSTVVDIMGGQLHSRVRICAAF